jgi:uncharacterized membrane protein
VRDTPWIWAEAFLHWLHVIAGIGWIGSSFPRSAQRKTLAAWLAADRK